MKSHVANSNPKQKKNKDTQKTHSVIDALELPKDILLGLPLLALEGNRSLSITNHRGLVRYGQDVIVVATQSGSIRITGRKLVIPRFTKDIIEIRGYLEGVMFL